MCCIEDLQEINISSVCASMLSVRHLTSRIFLTHMFWQYLHVLSILVRMKVMHEMHHSRRGALRALYNINEVSTSRQGYIVPRRLAFLTVIGLTNSACSPKCGVMGQARLPDNCMCFTDLNSSMFDFNIIIFSTHMSGSKYDELLLPII